MLLRRIGLEELVPLIHSINGQGLNSETSQVDSSLSGNGMNTGDPTDQVDSRFYEGPTPNVTSSKVVISRTVASKSQETSQNCSSDSFQAKPDQVWPSLKNYDSDSTKVFVHQKNDNDANVAAMSKSDVGVSASSCLLSENLMADGCRSLSPSISGLLQTKRDTNFFVTEELTEEDLEFDFPSEIFPSDNP